jgi:hypothetical protein
MATSRHPHAPTGEPPKPGRAGDDPPAAARAPAPAVKKPWRSPHVRTGHLFESNSLACGKNTPQLDQCLQNPLNS